MADTLASLKVLLGLDMGEYSRGLTKAEQQAKTFAENTRSSILAVGKVLGSLAIGTILIDQLKENTKAIISEAAALNDLAGSTGSSVEALSRLTNQAKIAGTDFATVQAAVLKLSQGMAGADEESNNAKEALRILGITAKDPVEALQQVAVKLNTYPDGVNKVGFAVALFGKQGAQFLATLKDMAELQDVAATTSRKQAEEAEKLEQALRRLSYESTKFKEAILSNVVPALNEMIERFRVARETGSGFFGALLKGLDEQGDAAPRLAAVTKEIEQLQKTIDKQKNNKSPFVNSFGDSIAANEKELEQLKQKQTFLSRVIALQDRNNASLRSQEDRGFDPRQQAPNPPSDNKVAKIKEEADEGLKLLDSLLKQQQATIELTEVEKTRIAIFEIELRKGKELNADIKERALFSASMIDLVKEEKEALQEKLRIEKEQHREMDESFEANRRAIGAAERERDSIRDGNEQAKEQLILLRDGEAALFAYTQAKLLKAAAEKEDKAASEEAAAEGPKFVQALKDQAEALRERAALLSDTKAAKDFLDQQKKLADDLNRLFDSAGSALLDFVSGTKSAKDAFKDFAKSFERDLAQMALAVIKNQLFNKGQGGNGIFDLFSNINWGSLFGGSSGGFSSSAGFGAGEFATGTTYAPGGMALVGENGPEVVSLPAGSRVTPGNQWGGGGGNVYNISVNVPRGANTQAHRQAALDAWRTASAANWRR